MIKKRLKKMLHRILPERAYERLRTVYKHMKIIHLYGNKYYCPCCQHNFRVFINFACDTSIYNKDRYVKTYKNTVCPYCHSVPRHRIIGSYYEKDLSKLKDKKILIFGMSLAGSEWFKRHKLSYKTADLFAEADYKIDIQNIDMSDQCMDVIFCNHVLEHVSDYKGALKELYRILKPKGILEVSVPILPKYIEPFEDPSVTDPIARKELFGQYDHLRIFGTNFVNDLKNAGFNIETLSGEDFDNNIRPVIGPADYDINTIYICQKG